MSFKKELKKVRDLAVALGFHETAENKHIKFFNPKSRRTVTVSKTPSCPYGFENAMRDLRKNSSANAQIIL